MILQEHMALINVAIWRNIIHLTLGLNCRMVLQLEEDSGKDRDTHDGFPRVSRTGHWDGEGQRWVTHTEELGYMGKGT